MIFELRRESLSQKLVGNFNYESSAKKKLKFSESPQWFWKICNLNFNFQRKTEKALLDLLSAAKGRKEATEVYNNA